MGSGPCCEQCGLDPLHRGRQSPWHWTAAAEDRRYNMICSYGVTTGKALSLQAFLEMIINP